MKKIILTILILGILGAGGLAINSKVNSQNLEKRIFYSRDILISQNYEVIAQQEKDTAMKAKYEKAAQIVEHKKNLLSEVEKDFKEGKGTFKDWNKRIDELMKIDPVQ